MSNSGIAGHQGDERAAHLPVGSPNPEIPMKDTVPSPVPHRIVSREQWLAARKLLLVKEKKFNRERDALTAVDLVP